jgi:predicted nucleic acid-binding protein
MQKITAQSSLTALSIVSITLASAFAGPSEDWPAWRGPSDAMAALEDITNRKEAKFIANDLPGAKVPPVTSFSDMTDAYLVALAKKHGLKLATLDDHLCGRPWAKGNAENPL